LIFAFVVYGLREIGEPARKALIASLLPEAIRAEGIGLPGASTLFRLDDEGAAAVLSPAVFVLLAAGGTLFSVRHGGDAVARHAVRDEVVTRGPGAALPEREIVLAGTALVAVPLDDQEHLSVRL
jgi:hypothetical protein